MILLSSALAMPAAGAAVHHPNRATSPGALPQPVFSYGYDLQQAPDFSSRNDPSAVVSARTVMASIPAVQDESSMGWGVGNPEPSPGIYNFASLDERIRLIESTGGTPVITLCGAPDWMKGGAPGTTNWKRILDPPFPSHYQDFANLAATIALRYPEVDHFVVWRELDGFWNSATDEYDAVDYTQMYNDVYSAIKAVRPDAQVGGPYSSMISWSKPRTSGAVGGSWGYLNQPTLDAISYWLANSVGADFVAVDGRAFTNNRGYLTDPVDSAVKYAVVDQWLRARTNLPIWWIESRDQLDDSWPRGQATGMRVAILAQMASSGAVVGMQWQPEEGIPGWPGEGLWTSLEYPAGGQPTQLAQVMPSVLTVLQDPVTVESGQPTGVMVATSAAGTIAVNDTANTLVVDDATTPLLLPAYAIRVVLGS